MCYTLVLFLRPNNNNRKEITDKNVREKILSNVDSKTLASFNVTGVQVNGFGLFLFVFFFWFKTVVSCRLAGIW